MKQNGYACFCKALLKVLNVSMGGEMLLCILPWTLPFYIKFNWLLKKRQQTKAYGFSIQCR